VNFKPSAAGTRSATLVLTDSDASSPQSVSLGGTGLSSAGPILTFSPTSLTFSGQQLGVQSPLQSVTLTNSGTATLNISSISINGTNAADFKTGSITCGKTLAPGTSCVVPISFTPTAEGDRSATLSIADDEAGSPQKVSLAGKGAGLTLIPSNNQTSATLDAGQAAMLEVKLMPTAFSGTVDVSCSGAPVGSSCTVSPSSVVLNGDAPAPLLVTVTTTSRGNSFPWNMPFRFERMLWVAVLGIFFLSSLAIVKKSLYRTRPSFALLMLFVAGLIGCAGTTAKNTATNGPTGGSNPTTTPGTPAGTSTLTLRASSGSAQATLPFTLTVK
jgi:hypothetical protein